MAISRAVPPAIWHLVALCAAVRIVGAQQPLADSARRDSLPAVFVRSHNYLLDSLENRREYKKVFDYDKGYVDGLKSGRGGRSLGVGIDFDMLLDGRKNRQMLALQKRLEYEEDEKYIDHRWNRSLIHRITGLDTPAIDTFMRAYRPSKEFIQSCETEYQFDHYIQEWGRYFADDWAKSHATAPK